MATTDNSKASPEAINDSRKAWDAFIQISKLCGIAVAVVLILMAVFLV